jgi:hypothetical protein
MFPPRKIIVCSGFLKKEPVLSQKRARSFQILQNACLPFKRGKYPSNAPVTLLPGCTSNAAHHLAIK